MTNNTTTGTIEGSPSLMSTTPVRIAVTRLQNGSASGQESRPFFGEEFEPLGDFAGSFQERFDWSAWHISAKDAKDRLQSCLREVLRDSLSTCHESDFADTLYLLEQIESECPYYQGGIRLVHLDGTEDLFAWEQPK